MKHYAVRAPIPSVERLAVSLRLLLRRSESDLYLLIEQLVVFINA